MRVYRLCRAAYADDPLSGEGARLYGGRWNPKGVRVAYCASTLSLAVLEILVHTSVLPADYVSIAIEIPDDLAIEVLRPRDRPPGWDATPAPAAAQRLGAQWVARGRAVALEVPSAVVPEETNILINPAHEGVARIVVGRPKAFRFDPRLR
jgi:RES domain-containing protein